MGKEKRLDHGGKKLMIMWWRILVNERRNREYGNMKK